MPVIHALVSVVFVNYLSLLACYLKLISSQILNKYNNVILNDWSVYYWHFYVTVSEIGEGYSAINDAFYGMFSVLCVVAINDNSCVYIHEQAMVKSACPGGVKTLQYLKHPISWYSIHNRCFTTYQPRLCWFTIYPHPFETPPPPPPRENFTRKLAQIKKDKPQNFL